MDTSQLVQLNSTSNSDAWDQKWTKIFDHYQQDLRHAYYIHAMLKADEKHLLEIGAGSFRDMAELRRRGLNCEAMDFSSESVERAKKNFPNFASAIHLMSGFDMPLADGVFDVTYHNGFWGCFQDCHISELVEEQARITRGRMIATVHNRHNPQFVDYFNRKKVDDPIYAVRFFTIEEITELMRQVCSEVTIIPVGKGKQHHEDLLIKNGITDPASIRSCLDESGMNYLESSERLMCIGVVR